MERVWARARVTDTFSQGTTILLHNVSKSFCSLPVTSDLYVITVTYIPNAHMCRQFREIRPKKHDNTYILCRYCSVGIYSMYCNDVIMLY